MSVVSLRPKNEQEPRSMYNIFEPGISELGVPSAPANERTELSQSERLYADLQAHREQHSAILAETKRAAGWAKTPLAAFLLQTIEQNDARQLRLLDSMSASVRDALYWTHTAEALPLGGAEAERAEAIESVKSLLRLEQERARTARK